MMGPIMDMVMMTSKPLMGMMKDGSQVYMISGEADCSAPPAEEQMMNCEDAMKVACQDVSDSMETTKLVTKTRNDV